jgi:hypothetical protein
MRRASEDSALIDSAGWIRSKASGELFDPLLRNCL